MASNFKMNNTDLMVNSVTGQIQRFDEINKVGTQLNTLRVPYSKLEQVLQSQTPIFLMSRCENNRPMLEICACTHLHRIPKSELIEHVLNCPSKVRVAIPSVKVQNQPQNAMTEQKIQIRSRL